MKLEQFVSEKCKVTCSLNSVDAVENSIFLNLPDTAKDKEKAETHIQEPQHKRETDCFRGRLVAERDRSTRLDSQRIYEQGDSRPSRHQSHHCHLAQEKHSGEARHKIGVGTYHLCRHERIRLARCDMTSVCLPE